MYRVFTLLVVLLGWVLFRAESIAQAGVYLRTMFGLNGAGMTDNLLTVSLWNYRTVLLAGVLCSTPLFAWLKGRLADRSEGMAAGTEAVSWILQLALFLVSVGALLMGAHNPFIYFNF